jgi:hypothetical protein
LARGADYFAAGRARGARQGSRNDFDRFGPAPELRAMFCLSVPEPVSKARRVPCGRLIDGRQREIAAVQLSPQPLFQTSNAKKAIAHPGRFPDLRFDHVVFPLAGMATPSLAPARCGIHPAISANARTFPWRCAPRALAPFCHLFGVPPPSPSSPGLPLRFAGGCRAHRGQTYHAGNGRSSTSSHHSGHVRFTSQSGHARASLDMSA